MNPFVYHANPSRVVFGMGTFAQLPAEIERLGCHRSLLLSTPHQVELARDAATLLGSAAAGIFDQAQMHVPAGVAAQASKAAKKIGADCLVATGGGSTIGLAKAIALESGLPVVAVPTTYAGSEMTPIYGITDQGRKRTGSDARVLPRTVIYDPELTLGLPVVISVTSGINAIAHAAEALYARDGNPIMETLAELGIRALARAIPAIRSDVEDRQARSDALYGAWLCGTTLGHVGMALHHKLCHTLGGTFNLPHAETHTIVLPHALAYNRKSTPRAMQILGRALASEDGPRALYELARDNGAPTALRDIGFQEADIAVAADIALTHPYWNPAPLAREALLALLQRAYRGEPPI
ncbi:maleylacetate reductase TftE (plasmid) [Cupriavidus necator N-1]|uniref:maleylacetate reductase n=1 Tax=Cupriavidus necator (strain ATCC 43291 / DSM 13513 / CCUG 52238 / LMG 8453 / N-1) TaxID=1042878 RepID=F8GVR8_CUPNN|nr:maleylacetate reductase [Cupriavidus necator]AEI82688.1 maleylacetate reductase TftE [Cupriavidus necator N-1]MDX6007682.1 maleylacetate reductase [Cupriavidus necator]